VALIEDVAVVANVVVKETKIKIDPGF